MQYYVTNEKKKFEPKTAELHDHTNNMRVIKIYPDIKRQEILGFGGAFTEASAYVWSRMSKQQQEKILELYFGESGNKYNFCRCHIQSCDFSLGNRAYVEPGDSGLKTFSIDGDKKYIIPFVKAALGKNPEMELMASPWSPPAFMKDTNNMNTGSLLKEYYSAWARMMVKYVEAYKAEGINITRMTVQNEPEATHNHWDSCHYTAEQEADFAVNYLRRELDAAGFSDMKILIWDHNKDRIIDRCKAIFALPGAYDAVDGIGFHWYTGDHFESVQYASEKYAGKELIFTEGCVEYSQGQTTAIENAERYAHDMRGNLNAGMNGFIDWNLLLDAQGGPNHAGNFCDAPIMCDDSKDTLDVKLSYSYIGHFSRFIKKGAYRVLASSFGKGLESVAFENTDKSIAVVVLNTTDENKTFEIQIGSKGCDITLEARSIMTACL